MLGGIILAFKPFLKNNKVQSSSNGQILLFYTILIGKLFWQTKAVWIDDLCETKVYKWRTIERCKNWQVI